MLNKYRTFIRVAETQNITQVARELNYTQSGVSHAIQALEDEIGLPLIVRTKNGIKLSHYGEDLLPDIRRLVNSEESVYQKASQFRGLQRGTLKVGAFTSVSMHWIPQIAAKIAREYPKIQFIQTHHSYDGIEAELMDGSIDVGFLTDYYKGPFEFKPLYRDEYLVVIPPSHPLASYERIPIEALNGEPLALMEEGGDYDSRAIVNQIKDPNIIHTVNEDFLAIPLVEEGIAISILPKLIIDCVSTTAIVKRFAVPRYREIGLAAKSFETAPPLVTLFTDFLVEFLEDWKQVHPESKD